MHRTGVDAAAYPPRTDTRTTQQPSTAAWQMLSFGNGYMLGLDVAGECVPVVPSVLRQPIEAWRREYSEERPKRDSTG